MSPHLTLYGAPTGNCFRAAIALDEAGLAYAVRPLALQKGEHKQAAYLAINPLGLVPSLVVAPPAGQPTVITQSNAIMCYAAENAGTGLLGPDPLARAKVMERYFYFLTEVIAPGHAAFRLRGEDFAHAVSTLNARALDNLLFANEFVCSGQFMAGDFFSLADIAAFTITLACRDAIDWPAVPELGRWFEHVAQRQGVQRGLAAFN